MYHMCHVPSYLLPMCHVCHVPMYHVCRVPSYLLPMCHVCHHLSFHKDTTHFEKVRVWDMRSSLHSVQDFGTHMN